MYFHSAAKHPKMKRVFDTPEKGPSVLVLHSRKSNL